MQKNNRFKDEPERKVNMDVHISFKEKFAKIVQPKLKEEFDIKNAMAMPTIEKVVVNMGVGELSKDKEGLESLTKDLSQITGQRPAIRKARISVAGFNLRRGMPVGISVNLRGEKAYNFVDKLVSVLLPRLRDFRGAKDSFDLGGNYTLGLTEHTIFPELNVSKSSKSRGMEITIVFKNSNKEISKRFLELLGLPFAKD